MKATARAGAWLRSIPEADAAALCDGVRAAHAALPESVPGCRPIFANLLYRLEADGYRISFSTMDGAPVIIAGDLAPQPKRKARKRR